MYDLISAIATAQGKGGVAIVRMSGEGALGVARAMFSHKGEYEHAKLHYGTIDCGAFSDRGLCVYFRAPHSFTGEDVVEFHCHGGTEIARGVLKRTLALGARLAEAGEFTRRAYLNGKLSLSAAEGLGEMIGARSEAQVRAGFLLYGETLTRESRELKARVLRCLAEVDADVDYPEEDLSSDTRAHTLQTLEEIEARLRALLSQYSAGKKIKSGVNVVLCGAPNAGKSSLLNALLGYDRAIVSAQAGTTRDIVEGELELGGVLFRLIDTAGLRESENEAEREGVRRAEAAIEGADVIVWLKGEEEPAFPAGVPVITVGAKSDLARRGGCDVVLSSRTGEGLEAFKALLFEKGFGKDNDGAFVLEERHYEALAECLGGVVAAKRAAAEGLPSELYAEDLKRAYDALGRLGGESASEDVVREIFSKFCVGK